MDKYKQYSKYFQVQKQDSPVVCREDECIVKIERFQELVMIENRYKLLIKNNKDG